MAEPAGSWTGLDQEQANHRLIVEFLMETVENAPEFDETGQPKPGDGIKRFHEEEFVRIMVPGDRDNIVCRPVRDKDKVQFAAAYAAFKQKMAQPAVGTLLETVPFMTKPQVMEYQMMGVRTAEQLVLMSDQIGQKFMGFQQLKRRVQDYLAAKEGAEPALKLRAELEKRDAEIEANKELTSSLKKTLEEQQKRIDELTRRK